MKQAQLQGRHTETVTRQHHPIIRDANLFQYGTHSPSVKPILILLNRGPISVIGIGNDMPQILELHSDTMTTARDMLMRKNSHRAYVDMLAISTTAQIGKQDKAKWDQPYIENTPLILPSPGRIQMGRLLP